MLSSKPIDCPCRALWKGEIFHGVILIWSQKLLLIIPWIPWIVFPTQPNSQSYPTHKRTYPWAKKPDMSCRKTEMWILQWTNRHKIHLEGIPLIPWHVHLFQKQMGSRKIQNNLVPVVSTWFYSLTMLLCWAITAVNNYRMCTVASYNVKIKGFYSSKRLK